MRRLVYPLAIFVLLLNSVGRADEPKAAEGTVPPEVKWRAFDDAVRTALAEDKHIMVDVYTDWCGWCKRLDRDTYSDPSVREVLDASYVSAKVNGESGKRLKVQGQVAESGGRKLLQFTPSPQAVISEQDLTRRQWGVRGFPSILFLTADGKVITKMDGYKTAEQFYHILNFIKDDLYEVMTFRDYLESLERDPEQGQDKS